MDKYTQAKLLWGLFLLFCFLAFGSNCKAWAKGEVIRSRGIASKSWKIRRDENPQAFQRYMVGMFIMNAVFFLGIVIWGVALFLWR